MAVIDRDYVITATSLYLPPENVLSDTEMRALLEQVIASEIPEDDDTYTKMTMCLFCKQVAQVNKIKMLSNAKLRRDVQLDSELEFFAGDGRNIWDVYLDTLGNTCTLIGYPEYAKASKPISITVVTKDAFKLNPYD